MKAVELEHVSYRYPESGEYAVRDLNLTVDDGDFVLITGRSGSGKSTLCRIVNGIIPRYTGGELTGSVRVYGKDASDYSASELAGQVGLVFQNPEDQILMSRVEDELAFGLENLLLSRNEMAERIRWASARLGVGHLLNRSTDELSGGEKQRVVLASILAMKPKMLVLDEPTSQLDPEARRLLYDSLESLNSDGVTVIAVEHNIWEIAPCVDWVFDMDSLKKNPSTTLKRKHHPPSRRPKTPRGGVVLEVSNLSGGLGGRRIIEGVSFTVCGGECLAVTGPNGSGKTTLVKHFNGLLKPFSGRVCVLGMDTRTTPTEVLASKAAYLPQNPSDMLFCDTVEDELHFTLRHLGVSGDVEAALARFRLSRLRDSYPRDLSVGERQRLAIAAVLIADPKLVVLDEPTRGIDAESRAVLVSVIRDMLAEGRAVVVVTQERELVEAVSTLEYKVG